MKKIWLMRMAVMVAVCASMLILATPALAIWEWCELDPEITIDGHTVTLQAMVQADPELMTEAIHGNAWFRVYVSKGIENAVITSEDKVKVKIFEDKRLVMDDTGAVVFDVALSVNTREAYLMLLKVSVDGVVLGEIQGSTADVLKARFTLP